MTRLARRQAAKKRWGELQRQKAAEAQKQPRQQKAAPATRPPQKESVTDRMVKEVEELWFDNR